MTLRLDSIADTDTDKVGGKETRQSMAARVAARVRSLDDLGMLAGLEMDIATLPVGAKAAAEPVARAAVLERFRIQFTSEKKVTINHPRRIWNFFHPGQSKEGNLPPEHMAEDTGGLLRLL